MATPAQIAANRRNARKSTGPKTTHGKATSSRNALKHGVCSSGLLPDEDPAEFEAFVDGICRDPVLSRRATNKQIREYADAKWHIRRADRALFILLEYGQEHPMEAIPQIHAVIKARSKYSRTRNVLFHKLYPFKEFKRLKSKFSKTKPIFTAPTQPLPSASRIATINSNG